MNFAVHCFDLKCYTIGIFYVFRENSLIGTSVPPCFVVLCLDVQSNLLIV